MNPKEQSRLDLMLRLRNIDIPRAAFWDNPTVAEINSRLVERDALRKENEELATALKQAGDKLSMVAPLCDESLDSSAALYARELCIESVKQKEASHE